MVICKGFRKPRREYASQPIEVIREHFQARGRNPVDAYIPRFSTLRLSDPYTPTQLLKHTLTTANDTYINLTPPLTQYL